MATASASLSFDWLSLLVPLSIESVCVCCLLRPDRLVLGGRGFRPCFPTPVGGGVGRWWLDDGVVWAERRGGGTAGGGFDAERRPCVGIGGARELEAELRLLLTPVARGDGVVGMGVVGAVCVDVGLISTPSGIVL